VSGNQAGQDGGGFRLTQSGTTATLVNCTVAHNIAAEGGGINITDATATVVNCTIAYNADTGNGAEGAGGLRKAAGTLTLAASHAGPRSADDNIDPADVNGTNTNNLLGGDPRLGPLQDNGGPTFTMALLPDSPAINAGGPGSGISEVQTLRVSGASGTFTLLFP